MSKEYQVSARKFRPQKFKDVTSQDFVTKTLKNAIRSGKIAHAYLFSGPRGVGKTTIARIFAKALNCENPQDGEPCGICTSCTEIAKGVHPDVIELDAASNRGIDDVRAIQDAARIYPMRSKYKFFIVDEVHMLTMQAFNALLKILEEPPPYLIFILATTNPEKLPPTIVSRCQRFILQRIQLEEIKNKLNEIAVQEKIKIDNESLFLIAKLGDGALRDALGIFDMAVSFCGNDIKAEELSKFLNLPDIDLYFNVTDSIHSGNAGKILSIIDDITSKGFDYQIFFNGLLRHLRNILLVKSTGNEKLLDETEAVRNKYKEESTRFTEEQLVRLLNVIFENEQRFRFSGSQRVLLEAMCVELCKLQSNVADITEIVQELQAIKKKTPDLKQPLKNEIAPVRNVPPSVENTPKEIPAADKEERKAPQPIIKEDSEFRKKLKELFDTVEYNPDNN